jgi:hypothetical protein
MTCEFYKYIQCIRWEIHEIRKIQFVPERSQDKWATNHEQSPRNKELRPLHITCGLEDFVGENHDDYQQSI